MVFLSSLFGRTASNSLFERLRHCVLTTIAPTGQPHARKVRVAARSNDSTHLWFVISKESGIVADVAWEPNVMLSVMNPSTQQLVHVSGSASVVGQRRNPLYLAPGFRQEEQLDVRSDDADIALLRVDVSEGRTAVDSEPSDRIFRIFQPVLGHSSDMGARRGSQ